MIITKNSFTAPSGKGPAKPSHPGKERERHEFVEQIKKEIESSTYKIKSLEIAEKVSQKIQEDIAAPQVFRTPK
ncbi:MAG: flagellar biosynthesis anti-sigma factor FlgM [Nitrospinota bacterium]